MSKTVHEFRSAKPWVKIQGRAEDDHVRFTDEEDYPISGYFPTELDAWVAYEATCVACEASLAEMKAVIDEMRDPLASRIAGPIVGLCDRLWVRFEQLGTFLFLASAWICIALYVLHQTALAFGEDPGPLSYQFRMMDCGIRGLGMLCWYQYVNRKSQ